MTWHLRLSLNRKPRPIRLRWRRPLRGPICNVSCRHRSSDEITLSDVAAELAQKVPVGARLHAFGDGFEVELAGHLDAAFEDHLAGLVVERAHDKGLIDLEFGKGDAGQLLHRRITGAVIVDR